MPRGGKRRHHCPPYLGWDEIKTIHEMRAEKFSWKLIEALFQISRTTGYNALVGRGTYRRDK